ncbi:Nonribosomal peptide synthetase lcsA [Frankliniella fusca]|uniref:Nonribosomal peptide synthetase lcsA n=1 Tax=Frankliniella fusca TaxID=407009 RepID=A0AAE1GR15_9NEOP|nr:Nonribosomal peptide synthetase lcsA [Frankliniella fusca]
MESDGPSPVTSPIKSEPSSPIASAHSSPVRSDVSSPIRSVVSSPLRSPQLPLPSTPASWLSASPLEDSQSAKRQKLDDTTQTYQGACHSEESESASHCRQLFSDNIECSRDKTLESPQHEQVFQENEFMDGIDGSSCGGQRRERRTSSSSSCGSISSISSSGSSRKESSSESDQELQESVSSSSCEDEDSSNDSDQEENSDESDSELFSPPIYNGCKLTQDEGVLKVMEMFTNCKLSKKQVRGILQCILKLLPENSNFPKSEYSLFEYVMKFCPITAEKVHFYCSECFFYIGIVDMECSICHCNETKKFFQIPLAEQICNLFENHGLADFIDRYHAERSNCDVSGGYSDLLDGSEFKRVHVDGQYNLDLLGHTDGISVSISSNVSLWPLEWVIAQLPPYLRFKFVLVNGIWLDECKPYMNTFFKPFVKELQDLYENGVIWTHPRTKVVQKSHVTAPCFCADAPARAQLQNILCHGGKYSCHFCEQKMKKLPAQPVVLGEKKKSRRRVYTFKETSAKLRTSKRMDDQGSAARKRQRETGQTLKPVKGVKGPSEVSKFPGCDRSTVVYPEYMHLLMCILKEFMRLWFEVDGPWSLKEHRDMINSFLKSISVPDFVTRIPRSTEHFSKWKANEFRSFLLFFSIIILSKCMKKEYFEHWILLVAAFYLLLQDYVSETDVAKSNILLRMFCRSFSVLYKPDFYTYYFHQLCHLSLTVQRYGPLHTNSAFMFESFNGTLSKYIHGTKNQGQELVNNIRIAFGVEVLRTRSVLGTAASQHSIDFRNPIRNFDFSEDMEILSSSGVDKEPLTAFYRAQIKHETFTCSLYSKQKKRNNYTVCFMSSQSETKAYGTIKYFCKSADNKQVALVQRMDVDHLNSFCHEESGFVIKHIIPVVTTNRMEVVDINAILFKVIRVANYVCLRPNKYEYNL